LKRNGLTQVLFNLPAGDFAAGERGIANDPRRVNEFREGVQRALEIAARLDCTRLNCLIGLQLADVPLYSQMHTIVENLRYAAEEAEQAGVKQLIEPLNLIDTPGFLVSGTAAAAELIDDAAHDNLWIQYDVYHMQRMEGNLAATIEEYLDDIMHIQIADSPLRNQPGTGEINFPYLFALLDQLDYDGWVSAEYKPLPDTLASLQWFHDWNEA
jgi:hydroxypyruvate isomerase